MIPLTGRARHVWFLVAGSTHPMHSQIDNGEILVTYADDESERLAAAQPDDLVADRGRLRSDRRRFLCPGAASAANRSGRGRATLLDLPLDPDRRACSLTVRCLANEVVVGLMSATLLPRP